jgi:hypothetical protein
MIVKVGLKNLWDRCKNYLRKNMRDLFDRLRMCLSAKKIPFPQDSDARDHQRS